MSRRGKLAAFTAAVLAATAALVASTPAAAVPFGSHQTNSFEGPDLEGWAAEDGGNTRGWWIEETTAQAHTGTKSLNYQLDGTWDNGTIWIEKAFTARVGTSVPVTVSYWGWTPASGGPGVGYWKTTASIKNTDHVLGATASNPPWDSLDNWDTTPEQYFGGWHKYEVSTTVDTTTSNGTIWVAIALHADFESKRTFYHFDDVSVTID